MKKIKYNKMENLKVLLIACVIFWSNTAFSTVTIVGGSDTDGTLCLGDANTVRIKTDKPTGPYNWQYSADNSSWGGLPSIGGAYGGSNNVEMEITAKSTAITGYYRCQTGESILITVANLPVPVITLTDGECANSVANYTTAADMSGYSWTVTGTAAYTPSGNSLAVTWGAAASTGTVSVNYTDINGCTATSPTSRPVTVNAFPVLTSSTSLSAVCSDGNVLYTPTSSIGGSSFNWSRAVVGGIDELAGSGTGDLNEVLTNIATGQITVTYDYTVTANGCTNPATYNVTVPVNPVPTVTSTVMSQTICTGKTAIFTLNTINSPATLTTFNYIATTDDVTNVTGFTASDNGLTDGTALTETINNGHNTFHTVTYRVTPYISTCTGSFIDVLVVVNPSPAITQFTKEICTGTSTNFNLNASSTMSGTSVVFDFSASSELNVTGITASGTNLANGSLIGDVLTNDDQTIYHTATYNVIPKAAGCNDGTDQNITVYVNPLPKGNSTSSTQTICDDAFTDFTLNSTNTLYSTPITFDYSATSDGSVSGYPITSQSVANGTRIQQQLSNSTTTTSKIATYTVTPKASGCSNGPQFNVDVTVLPFINYGTIASGDEIICYNAKPDDISLSTAPSGGSGSFSYHWYYMDGLHTTGGTVPADWNDAAATGSTFTTPNLTTTRTYALWVTPTGSPACGTAGWASGVRQITVLSDFNRGSIIGGDQTICYNDDPNDISIVSPGGSSSFNFHWYYKDDIVTTGGTLPAEWNDATVTTSSLTTPNLTTSRTYALWVTPTGTPTCGTSGWAAGVRQITVLPNFDRGSIISGDETVCNNSDPNDISINLPVGSGNFNYHWYYKDGLQTTGATVPADWNDASTTISSFTTPVLTTTRTYALWVTPTGTPTCGSSGWASGVRQITVLPNLDRGTITSGDESICYNSDPNDITITLPTGSGSFNYHWYYKDGLQTTGATLPAEWTDAVTTTSDFTTPVLTTTRTYALWVTPTGSPTCGTSGWAANVRQITVLPTFDRGSINNGDQTICNNTDPNDISITLPAGSGSFNYHWYYNDGLQTTGATVPADWNDAGVTGSAFTTPLLTTNRTYALWVTPTGSPTCGSSGWASSVRQITVLPAMNYRAILSGDENLCYNADPNSINLDGIPQGSGSFSYQWYYLDGINSPATVSDPGSWTQIASGGTGSSYDPPAGLTATRSYAVRIIPGGSPSCGTESWATGARQITVQPTMNYGTITNANETVCSSGDASNIDLSVSTAGSASFQYEWYYYNGIVSAPTSGLPAGWNLLATTGIPSYNPSEALTASRTYALRVVPGGTPTCGITTWASGARQVTVVADPGLTNPSGTTLCSGGDHAMSVTVSGGTGTPTYDWQYSANPGGPWTSLTRNFNNYTATNVTSEVYYQATVSYSGTGCDLATTATPAHIIVAADPTITNPVGTVMCSGGDHSMSVTTTGGTGTPTFNWEYSENGGATWTSLSNNANSYIATNLTVDRHYRASISYSGVGCDAATSATPAFIDIVPDPSFSTNPAGATICTGGDNSMSINVSGGTGVTTYDWESSPDGLNWTSLGVNNVNYTAIGLISPTFYRAKVNQTGVGCNSATSSLAIVNVIPDPVITDPLSATICNGGTYSMSIATSGGTGTNTYEWQLYNTGTSTWDNLSVNNKNYTTPVLVTGTYNYRAFLNQSGSGCNTATSNTAVITVVNDPTVTDPIGTDICTGGTHTMNVSPAGGTGTYSYDWQISPDGSTGWTSLGVNNSIYTSPALGTTSYYRVVLHQSGQGCSDAISNNALVTVKADPSITNPSDASICTGTTHTFTVASGSGGVGTKTFFWEISNDGSTGWTPIGSDNYIYTSDALTSDKYYRVTLKQTGVGCNDAVSSVAHVTVNSLPSANAQCDTICALQPLLLHGISPTATKFRWSGPNNFKCYRADTTVNPSAGTSFDGGRYILTVTDINGCTNKDTVYAGVRTLPVASALNNGPKCVGQRLSFTGGPNGVSYLWTGPNGFGRNVQNPYIDNVTSAANGTYTLLVTDAYTCTNSATTTVTINSLPTPKIYGVSNAFNKTQTNVQLHATPSGGIFSGKGVFPSDSSFYPNIVGVTIGTPIVYTYTDGNTCSNSDTLMVSITSAEAIFNDLKDAYCYDADDQLITVTALDIKAGTFGTFTHTKAGGLIDNGNNTATIRPSQMGAGDDEITFTYRNTLDVLCKTNQKTYIDSVNTVDFSGLKAEYCSGDVTSEQLIPKNVPAGGTTIWINPNNDTTRNSTLNLSPGSYAASNTYDVSFMYMSLRKCLSKKATHSFYVNPKPELSIINDTLFFDGAKPELLIGKPAGGDFSSLVGIIKENGKYYFDPGKVGQNNSVAVNYNYTDSKNCPNTFTAKFNVIAASGVINGIDANSYCYNGPYDTLSFDNPDADSIYFKFNGVKIDRITGSPNSIAFKPSEIGSGVKEARFFYRHYNTWFEKFEYVKIDSVYDGLNIYPEADSACVGGDAVKIFAENTFPSGGTGTWDGPGIIKISELKAELPVSSQGLKTIVYRYKSPSGCYSKPDTTTVFVNPLPDVTLDLNTVYFLNGPNDTLKAKNVTGGTFTGPGIISNILQPAIVGVTNNNLITFTYTDKNTGCSNSNTSRFDVLTTVEQFSGNVKYCYGGNYDTIRIINARSFNTNGTFSIQGGSGIVEQPDAVTAVIDPSAIKGSFIEGIKTDKIIYTYNISKAAFKLEQPITVDSISNDLKFSIKDNETAFCNDRDPVTIQIQNKYPDGGDITWTGNSNFISSTGNDAYLYPKGNSTGSVSPGNYEVDMKYTTKNGCSKTYSKTFVINPLPDPEFVGLLENYNYKLDNVQLHTRNALGGYAIDSSFSSDGVFVDQAGMMKLDDTHIGPNKVLRYTFTDSSGCSKTVSATINVLASNAKITNLPSLVCFTDDTIVIKTDVYTSEKYIPKKASFTGDGIIDYKDSALFIPRLAGKGDHTINYTYRHSDDTTWFTVDQKVTVDFINKITFVTSNDDYCHGKVVNTITANQPLEGSGKFYIMNHENDTNKAFWSVANEAYFRTDSMIARNLATYEDTVRILYNYKTDLKECSFDTIKKIVIHAVPKADFSVPDLCFDINNKPEITFENNTWVDNSFTCSYFWDFGDNQNPNDTSTKFKPSWRYKEAGTKSVSLKAISKKFNSCYDTIKKEIVIDDRPQAIFDWNSECYISSDSIKFTNNSKSKTTIDLKDTITWKFKDLWDNKESLLISKSKVTYFKFTKPSDYKVSLIVQTKNGCKDTASKDFHLRHTYEIKDIYSENFINSSGGEWWSNNTSKADNWIFGNSQDFSTDVPNQKVWYTALDNNNSNKVSTWVTGPCFDFTDVKKPMIKLKLMKLFDVSFNGAVLQARSGDDTVFYNVGAKNEGINWYNSTNIVGKPANQSEGWTANSSGKVNDTSWIDARLNLDNYLKGKKNVQLRFTFAKSLGVIGKGMAFKDIWIGERSKVLLLEHFTSTNKKLYDDNLDNVVKAYSNDFIDIRYHIDDEFTDTYSAGPNTRVNYYRVPAIPYTLIDGGFETNTKVAYSSSQNPWSSDAIKNAYNTRLLEDPKLYFTAITQDRNTGSITIKLTANEIISNPTTLYVAVVEKSVESSGVIYKNVLRKFLPNPAGTSIPGWYTGDVKDFNFSWNYVNISNMDSVKVIAFIQDDITKEIYQTATDDTTFHSGTSIQTLSGIAGYISLYPNPASKVVYAEFSKISSSDCYIGIYNQLGMLVRNFKVESGTQITSFNISSIKPGIYLVKAISGNQLYKVARLVIVK